jgi:hypothetical protein
MLSCTLAVLFLECVYFDAVIVQPGAVQDQANIPLSEVHSESTGARKIKQRKYLHIRN